ncbi:hypothetical protein ALC57_00764 [Trachymyrmex cornetzi]|uniref:Uncharacterized protein n=1 Tax=Trachymyrmex cornetzi TaxID=471704 RepID=A0A151JQU0_9HYME|nr:hypothetical protein ALC57_00764 [Trachymyrmex cornetzi]
MRARGLSPPSVSNPSARRRSLALRLFIHGSGESRPFRLFPEPSPLARADFASSPPRRTPASRAFHGRRGSLVVVYSRLSSLPRRHSADSTVRWNGDEGRKDREIRATKRVLKFRRLHLVHSSAVAAQQTVAVTALILEFSLSLPRLAFTLSDSRTLLLFLFSFFYYLSSLSASQRIYYEKSLPVAILDSYAKYVPILYTRITKYFITKYFCTQNSARFLYIRYMIRLSSEERVIP